MRRQNPETRLQLVVVKYLRVALPDDAVFWHISNGGPMREARRRLLSGMGERPGASDLMILHRGQLHCIELKVNANPALGIPKTTHQTEVQKQFQRDITRAGGFYAVCRSLDDVQQCLAHWGIPTVARAA